MTEYQKLLRRRKFWSIVHKVFPEKKYYFVVSVRETHEKRPDGSDYIDHDSRGWGFYKSKKKAIRAIRENWTDINEDGYYHWAMIETYNEGLVSQDFSEEDLWFEEDYVKLTTEDLKEIEAHYPEDLKDQCRVNPKTGYTCWWNEKRQFCTNFNGYKPCEKPEWAEHICGWAF